MAHILVADDDALVRKTITLVLRKSGHVVSEASDGVEVLEAVAEIDCKTLDLVITDILMPNLDGIGLILALRAQCPSLRFLCISGGGRDQHMQYLEFARKLGAHLVLSKPFTPQELERAVAAALLLPDVAPGNVDEC